MPRILIASASAGTGHLRAADALLVAARAAGAEAEHVDVLQLAPRWVAAAYGGGFELLVSRAPALWRGIYMLADGAEPDTARWGRFAEALLFREFRRVLVAAQWEVCLCTHFLPAQLAAGRVGVPPFALVLTDFAEHRFWLQPRVQRYFVASERLAEVVASRLPRARVSASGIPVDPALAGGRDRTAARAALGLPTDARIALVVGGGWGMGVEATALAAARCLDTGLHLVVVCGRNTAARERLRAAIGGHESVHVLGHVPNLLDYMAAADLVVSKPGGLTCSEALAIGRPLVLTEPVPGHEEANARELSSLGAAVTASKDQLEATLRQLLSEPERLARLAASAARIGRPNAAAAIGNAVIAEFTAAVAA